MESEQLKVAKRAEQATLREAWSQELKWKDADEDDEVM